MSLLDRLLHHATVVVTEAPLRVFPRGLGRVQPYAPCDATVVFGLRCAAVLPVIPAVSAATHPLVAEQFGRRYRKSLPWATQDVSFVVPEGSIAALVGPNGAGKSTLLRACLGFEIPDAGRLLVFGADPQVRRRTAVEAVGYIPQGLALYRGLAIRDHFTMALAARPSFDDEFAQGLIREAGLGERRKVGELSGGEQAQVALALALGTRAPLLLLDEPLA